MIKRYQNLARHTGLWLGGCLLAGMAQAVTPATGVSISPGLGTLSQLLGWLGRLLAG